MNTILFSIDQQRFGLDLSSIERVIHAVEITSLPHAPDHIMGAINIQGSIVQVINLRTILGLPSREIELSDQFIICRLKNKKMALWVDTVCGIEEYTKEALIPAREVFPNIAGVDFVVKEKEDFILIYNLEKLIPGEKDDM